MRTIGKKLRYCPALSGSQTDLILSFLEAERSAARRMNLLEVPLGSSAFGFHRRMESISLWYPGTGWRIRFPKNISLVAFHHQCDRARADSLLQIRAESRCAVLFSWWGRDRHRSHNSHIRLYRSKGSSAVRTGPRLAESSSNKRSFYFLL